MSFYNLSNENRQKQVQYALSLLYDSFIYEYFKELGEF